MLRAAGASPQRGRHPVREFATIDAVDWAGPIGTALAAVGLWYFSKSIWKEWREHRAFVKEIEEANVEGFHWSPPM